MFDSPFDFLSVVIAIVALVVARKAFNRIDELRMRLDAMQAAAAPARSVPPPLPPQAEAEQAPPLVSEPWPASEAQASVPAAGAPPFDIDAVRAEMAPPPLPP